MILDTLELKNNNWVPRNAGIQPKTLSEIKEEFKMSPTNNLTISRPTERPSNNNLKSNVAKVIRITITYLFRIQ